MSKSIGLGKKTVILMLFCVTLCARSDDDLFRISGLTLSDLVSCVRNSMIFDPDITVRHYHNGEPITEKIILMMPFTIKHDLFSKYEYVRMLTTASIMHSVCVITLIKEKNNMRYVTSDLEAITFIQKATEKEKMAEKSFEQCIRVFMSIRGYNLVESKPDLKSSAWKFDGNLPDSEWGCRVFSVNGKLKGSATVVTDVYNKVISQFEFDYDPSIKQIILTNTKVIYSFVGK
jgi:hypothetical protein